MRRKWAINIVLISLCFILPKVSLAAGEDIWVISTGGEATFHTLLDDDYQVTTKTVDEIAADGIPSSVELLIYPGGLYPIMQVQDAELVEAIQDYIYQGGAFFGSCGGSITGAQTLSWDYGTLPMLGVAQVQATDRLAWMTTVSYTDGFIFNGNSLNGDYASQTQWLMYSGGPAFEVVDGYEDEVEVLATFADNFDPTETSYYQVKGKAAIVKTSYGQGELILSAPHPESDADTQFLFYNYVEDLLPVVDEEPDTPDDPVVDDPGDDGDNEEDDSGDNDEEIADPPAEEIPDYVISKVKNVRAPKKKIRQKKVYLKWNKLEGVSGYNIKLFKYNKQKKKFVKKRVVKVNKNRPAKWVKNLKSGKKYKVRVRAKAELNAVVASSFSRGPWSKGVIFKTK